jgi:hypothetical protein
MGLRETEVPGEFVEVALVDRSERVERRDRIRIG